MKSRKIRKARKVRSKTKTRKVREVRKVRSKTKARKVRSKTRSRSRKKGRGAMVSVMHEIDGRSSGDSDPDSDPDFSEYVSDDDDDEELSETEIASRLLTHISYLENMLTRARPVEDMSDARLRTTQDILDNLVRSRELYNTLGESIRTRLENSRRLSSIDLELPDGQNAPAAGGRKNVARKHRRVSRRNEHSS